MRGDEQIAAEVDAPTREGVSMDVLLQLTLPIVLILAFLVVTEVHVLTEQIEGLKKDVEGTATGRLMKERDVALIDLQLQVLYLATNDVAEELEEELDLRRYPFVAPAVADVRAGDVAPDFAVLSRKLAAALNEREGERTRTEAELRRRVEERFAELVAAELPDLDGEARRKVLEITDENRSMFEIKLAGHLERFVETAAAAQLDLLLEWLRDPVASANIREDSLTLWGRIQGDLAAAAAPAGHFDPFLNLKVDKLVERLAELDVPVLERTLQLARQ